LVGGKAARRREDTESVIGHIASAPADFTSVDINSLSGRNAVRHNFLFHSIVAHGPSPWL
jgi:hypothetical protein